MMRARTTPRTWLMFLAALGAAAAPALTAGCTGTCEDSCQDQYQDCVERSPPGASKADCAEQYDRCMATCASLVE